jgi:hypothetical protein
VERNLQHSHVERSLGINVGLASSLGFDMATGNGIALEIFKL